MFSINEFRSQGLPWGGARSSLFDVECTFPPLPGANIPPQLGSFKIMATQLPAFVLGECQAPYFGRFIKFKGDRTFQDWTCHILNDEDFILRNAFEAWQNGMNYMESNVMDPLFVANLYKAEMRVIQYAKDAPPGSRMGNPLRDYTMVGAWPKIVSPINLDWSEQNRIESFEVTFAYDYFLIGGKTADFPTGF